MILSQSIIKSFLMNDYFSPLEGLLVVQSYKNLHPPPTHTLIHIKCLLPKFDYHLVSYHLVIMLYRKISLGWIVFWSIYSSWPDSLMVNLRGFICQLYKSAVLSHEWSSHIVWDIAGVAVHQLKLIVQSRGRYTIIREEQVSSNVAQKLSLWRCSVNCE